MALSKNQQRVVDLMGDGWALGLSCGRETCAWLQQDGLGRGGATEKVTLATFNGLWKEGAIKAKGAGEEYVLVDGSLNGLK